MGCDIHFHVEKKTDQGWVRAEPQVKNEYYDKWDDEPEFKREDFYDGRNYSLFAMLADVRNGYGLEPITATRGIPKDVSDDVRQEHDDWGIDGHSHGWLSLRELLTVPWHEKQLTHQGWVMPDEFDRWDKYGRDPESWCQGVGGRNVRHIEPDEMRALIADGTIDPRAEKGPISYYTHISWGQSWAKSAAGFMPTLVRMANVAMVEGLDLDSIRAVFWFDN
jgi:hypothetical protein